MQMPEGMGRRGGGGEHTSNYLWMHYFVFLFSKYWKSTGKVRERVRVRVRKKYQNFKCGYGNGYGWLPLAGTEIWYGVRIILSTREYVNCTDDKWAKFLVRVRVRVRINFKFVSTGTEPVSVPALRGMIYLSYNILYNFQENQRTKNGTLFTHFTHFTSLHFSLSQSRG